MKRQKQIAIATQNLDRRIIGAFCLSTFLLTSNGFYTAAGADASSPRRLGRPAQEGGVSTSQVQETIGVSTPSGPPQVMTEDQKIAHLLNRITFGPRPGDVQAVKSEGIKNYINAQLNPSSISEEPRLAQRLQNSPILQEPAPQLIAEFRQFQKERQELKKQAKDGGDDAKIPPPDLSARKRLGQEAIDIRIDRAVNSNRQLQEVMTDFWYNHFNISVDKGLDHALVGAYEEQAIRPYALGHFRDLLGATCHHPAMLFYLDNWQNSKAGGQDRKGKETGINENYARELMELHTLGVDGGYTQKDVQEMARVLTGLGLQGPRRQNNGQGQGNMAFGGRRRFGGGAMQNFGGQGQGQGQGQDQQVGTLGDTFNPNHHDFGDKVVLGQRIAGTGEGEIEKALDMLAAQPATAHHIAYQLAQYFVADNPPRSLVDKLANRFSQTNGDIKAVMSTLLESPEFWDGRYSNDKYKSPFRFAVSVLRATEAQTKDYMPIAQFLRLQGQPVYGCLTPDGYKNTQEAWLNPDALINRINFATSVGTGKAKFLTTQPVDFDTARDTVNAGRLSPHTDAVISKAPPALKLSLLIGSPEFMHY